jgi:DNA-binding NarL/FixJ family response regulator
VEPKTILLVDDDPLVLALLAHVVGQLAPMHPIVTAADGRRALDLLAEHSIAVVITDYLLPDTDGLQLTTAIKAVSPATYVVLVSGDDSAAFRRRVQNYTVDRFLGKQELLAELGGVLRSVLPAQ